MTNLNNISANDLRNDEKMILLYKQAVARHDWPCTTRAVLDFFALSEKALHDDQDGTPGKLFAWLVAERKTDKITDRQEIRAEQRLLKHDKQDIVDGMPRPVSNTPAPVDRMATDIAAAMEIEEDILVRNIGYLPNVAVQCFFPQRPIADRAWKFHHGRTSLLIKAGEVPSSDPRPDFRFRECAVPSGYLSRMLFAFICGEAVKTKSPEIDMGRSMRQFFSNMGVTFNGAAGRRLTRAVEDIASASFTLLRNNEARGVNEVAYSRLVGAVSFWLEKDENQHTIWQPELCMSQDFFAQIMDSGHVPVDMDHLARLTRSPRRMDLYTWLSYRTPLIKHSKRVSIRLADLQGLFARDINNPRLFKQRLRQDLQAISKVYSLFNTELKGDMLLLRYSPPPIPYHASLGRTTTS